MAAKLRIEILAINNTKKVFSEIERSIGKLDGSGTGVGGALQKGLVAAGTAAVVAVGAAAVGMGKAIVDGVKEAASLQQVVADTIAKADPSEQTADYFAKLTQLAQDLGKNPNLKVSIKEAASISEMLVQQGIKVQEVLDGATKGVIELGNATGSDFELSAKTVGDAMNIFGMGADEMGVIVDGATGVINSSKFTLQDYYYAVANGAGAFSAMGGSIQDFNTLMAGTANYFSSGQTSGTAFKTFLSRMVPQSDKAAAAMERWGISFYTAEGALKPMPEIVDMLNTSLYGLNEVTVTSSGLTQQEASDLDYLTKQRQRAADTILGYKAGVLGLEQTEEKRNKTLTAAEEALKNADAAMAPYLEKTGLTYTNLVKMTDAERQAALTTIFGTRGLIFATAAGQMTSETYQQLYEDVNRTGQAAEAAEIRTRTLGAAWENFNDVITATLAVGGVAYLDPLEKIVRSLSVTIDLLSPQIARILQIPAGWLGDVVAPAFEKMMEDIQNNRFEIDLGDLFRFSTNWNAALNGQTWTLDVGAMRFENTTQFGENFGRLVLGSFKIDWRKVLDPSKMATDFHIELGDLFQFDYTAAAKNFVTSMRFNINDVVFGSLRITERSITANINDLIVGNFNWALKMGKLTIGDLIDFSGKVMGDKLALTLNDQQIEFDLSGFNSSWNTFVQQLNDAYATGGAGAVATTIVGAMWLGIQQAVVDAPPNLNFLTGILDTGFSQLAGYIQTIWDGTNSPLQPLKDMIGTALTDISSYVNQFDFESIGSMLSSAGAVLLSLNLAAGGFDEKNWAGLTSGITGLTTSIIDAATALTTGINTDVIAGNLSLFTLRISAALQSAFSSENMTGIGASAGRFVGTIASQIGALLGSPGFGAQLGTNIKNATIAFGEGAQALVEGFAGELGATDWGVIKAQLTTFSSDFLASLAAELAGADWGAVGTAIRDGIVSGLTGIWSMDWLRGPGGTLEQQKMQYYQQRLDTEARLPANQQAAYRDETAMLVALIDSMPQDAQQAQLDGLLSWASGMTEFRLLTNEKMQQALGSGVSEVQISNAQVYLGQVPLGSGGTLTPVGGSAQLEHGLTHPNPQRNMSPGTIGPEDLNKEIDRHMNEVFFKTPETFPLPVDVVVTDQSAGSVKAVMKKQLDAAVQYGQQEFGTLDPLSGAPTAAVDSSWQETLDIVNSINANLNAGAAQAQGVVSQVTSQPVTPPVSFVLPAGPLLPVDEVPPLEVKVKPVPPTAEEMAKLPVPPGPQFAPQPTQDFIGPKTMEQAFTSLKIDPKDLELKMSWPADMPELQISPYPKWVWTAYPKWTWPDIPESARTLIVPPMPPVPIGPYPTPPELNVTYTVNVNGADESSTSGGGKSGGTPPKDRPARALGGPVLPNRSTLVGEFGPEVVQFSRPGYVYTNRESEAMQGQAPINVVVNADVSSGIDVEGLAYRVADVIKKRGRR